MKIKIDINDLMFTASIGIHEHEKKEKQPIIISLSFVYNAKNAISKDEISHAIDYSQIDNLIYSLIESTHFNLIETLAAKIYDSILKNYAVETLFVTLKKPNALPQAKWVSTTISSDGL